MINTQGNDFYWGIAVMFLYVSLLADLFVTRWGVWNYGLVEKNPLIRNRFWDLTKSAGLSFVDGAIRTGLIGAYATASDYLGLSDDSLWYVPLIFAAPSLVWVVKNLVLIRRFRTKK